MCFCNTVIKKLCLLTHRGPGIRAAQSRLQHRGAMGSRTLLKPESLKPDAEKPRPELCWTESSVRLGLARNGSKTHSLIGIILRISLC